MAFKSKTKNRNPINQNRTIDAIHIDILNKFDKNKKNIKNYYKQLEILNNKLAKLRTELNKNKNIIETLDLQKKIWDTEKNVKITDDTIYNIENGVDEKEYLINTGNILNQYYKVKETESGNDTSVRKKKQIPKKTNNIISWFEKPELILRERSENDNIDTNESSNFNNTINSVNDINIKSKKDLPKNKYDILTKKELHQKYMLIIDKEFELDDEIQEDNYDICSNCNIDMLLNVNTSLLICSNCGIQESIILDIDKPSYKDPPKEITSFCYKRINHLNEFLAQFQAKETTEIPESLYNEIMLEIKKERITNMTEINCDKMRLILKKIKRNEYYEHVPYIINQLNGLPPPIISCEIEEVIRSMFKEIQIPFEELRPNIIPKRKNFLSYNYIMYKFFELLELDEYLQCFQLLKSRNKLYQQDTIWKHICAQLNWQYIPSL
jgi:hypothetical protein